jgi:hypothetical protein
MIAVMPREALLKIAHFLRQSLYALMPSCKLINLLYLICNHFVIMKTDRTYVRTELFCTDFDISEVRKFPSERFYERGGSVFFNTFRPEIVPFNPRNPQQPSDIGQAKDHRAKGNTMRIIPSVRSLLFALVIIAISAASFAQIGISISFAPPELPVYEQPPLPGEGYIWTPGYWAYSDDDYYWVPGTWVMAPEPGLLWTPAYWGWGGNGYVFYDGYWGQTVGFYGGISYGYGYYGEGYEGGRWQGREFFYNRSVNNVNVTNIHNVYNTTVINNNTTVNRVSYNGGTGGINRRPRPEEEAAARQRHIPPVAVQTQHAQAARANPEFRASVNHGTPRVAATPKPGAFNDRAVVPAKQAGTPYNRPVNRAAVQPPANSPAARPENKAARTDRPAPNRQPESNRPPAVQPNNRPDSNRTDPNRSPAPQPNNRDNRPPTAQPNNRPENNRPPAAQPNNRPESNRNEPAQRPQSPPPNERSQPQRTPPPAETRSAPQQQQHSQPAPPKQEEQKRQEPPKRNEKPPQ